jgi:hypothetical protein
VATLEDVHVLYVQAKYDNYLEPKGWNQLIDMAEENDGIPILAGRGEKRKLKFWRLTERKDGVKGPQPFREVSIIPRHPFILGYDYE